MSLTSEKWASGINFLAGLWLIAVPFWFGASGAVLWSGVISGIVIAVLGAYDYWLESQGTTASPWAAGIAGLFGLWMIAAPFLFLASSTLMWSDAVAGVVVAILGAYNAYDAEGATESPGGERSTGV